VCERETARERGCVCMDMMALFVLQSMCVSVCEIDRERVCVIVCV